MNSTKDITERIQNAARLLAAYDQRRPTVTKRVEIERECVAIVRALGKTENANGNR